MRWILSARVVSPEKLPEMVASVRVFPESVSVHGFSPWSNARLAAAVEKKLPPEAFPGDFVLFAKGYDAEGPFEMLLSTALACHNYYWYNRGAEVVHGSDLFDVVQRAGLGWDWNRRALLTLLTAEYTTGEDTLHREIKRFRPATRVVWRSHGISVSTSPFWSRLFDPAGPRSSSHESEVALSAALSECDRWRPALSLSAGFDSRAILALLLRSGIKPVVGTMGFAESTDMVVATAIAKRFGLEHRRVELSPHDYLSNARRIVRITGGTKTADHWHTYIYIRNVGFDTDCLHWAGSNGEFARTTWFDRKPLAELVDSLPWDMTARILRWRFRAGPYARRMLAAEVLGGPNVAGQDSVKTIPEHFVRLARGRERPLDQLDRFVALHPTRHFIGNGLSLYSSVIRTHSPFLDSRWMETAARLPRWERTGSNFHRFVIEANCPALREYPVGREANMLRRAPWCVGNPKGQPIPYSDFDLVRASAEVRELLWCSPHLNRLFDPLRLRTAIDAGVLSPVLLALHFTGELAAECAGKSRAVTTSELEPAS